MIMTDCDYNDLARHLGLKPPALHAKFEDRSQWKLEEVYAVCDKLHLPLDQIHYYFPRKEAQK